MSIVLCVRFYDIEVHAKVLPSSELHICGYNHPGIDTS